MKNLMTTIAMILLLAQPALAQEQKRPRFNPEEFRAKMEAYISQKACLTQAESEKVFPIFHEMKQKQRELMKKEHKLKRNTSEANTSDKKYQEALMQIADLHEKAADLEEDYYEKMCKAISPKKVFAIIQADDAFHREMLQRFSRGNEKPRPRK